MSRIIKSSNISIGEPLTVKVPVLNIEEVKIERKHPQPNKDITVDEAKIEAQKIIHEAKIEANKVLEDAKAYADNLVNEAINNARTEIETSRQQEYQNAYEEATTTAQNEYFELIEDAKEVKEHAIQEYQELLRGMEKEVIGIIINIAKKTIAKEIAEDNEYILSNIKEAFERCAHKKDAVIKLCSQDYYIINENLSELVARIKGFGDVKIQIDSSLEQGDIIIETLYGTLDSSVATRIAMIEEAFTKMIER